MAYSPEPLKSKPTGGGDIPPPDWPLTTGEGNTTLDPMARALQVVANDALRRLADSEAECGRLRAEHEEWVEATARAHSRLREQLDAREKLLADIEALARAALGVEGPAENKLLREQLDAARTQLGEVEYGLENLRGWWPDGKLAARQSWLAHIERHAAAVRAALGVEGPAE